MSAPRQSSATTYLVIAALALGGLGVYLKLGRSGGEGGGSSDPGDAVVLPSKDKRDRGAVRRLRISPQKLDLGTISQCGPLPSAEVVLANDGPEPVRITGWAATCSCVSPELTGGAVIEPGGMLKVPIRVDPLGIGGKSQRIDFRLEGNSRGGALRVDYRVESAIIPTPVLVVRPDGVDSKVIDLDRIDVDGNPVAEKFVIRSIEPPVARFVGTLEDGHAAIDVDFKAIDRLAEGFAGRGGGFEWDGSGESARWKALDLLIETDCAACQRLRVRVRNR